MAGTGYKLIVAPDVLAVFLHGNLLDGDSAPGIAGRAGRRRG
jgi:hypothetical protein